MKTKYPVLELAIGTLLVIIFILLVLAVCQPKDAYGQAFGIPLKQEYDKQAVQNELNRLWGFILSMDISDHGSATFDTASHYDTIYTNIKYDSIMYVSAIFDTTSESGTWGQNVAWVGTLSDSSVIIMRALKVDLEGKFQSYKWQVIGRVKRP